MRSLRSPVPTCDLRSAERVAARVDRCCSYIRARRNLHRLGAVLVLAALLLHRHDDPSGEVGDADGAFRLVDVLAAGAGCAVDVDLEVVVVDLDIDFLGFGQDGDGDGRGVNAALAFRRGDALDTVDAGFVLQPGRTRCGR